MASSSPSDQQVTKLLETLGDLHGSLVEVYVFSTDRQGWNRVLDVLATRGSGVEITVDGEPFSSRDLDELDFDLGLSRVMRAQIDGDEWTSTLYREDQVDVQLAPEDFEEPEAVARLLAILQDIADATEQRAVLIAETPRPEEAVPLAVADPS